jgi:ribosomal protein S18 acetylase RimI-like enzyme
LKKAFQTGHPDFMNILDRIDFQIDNSPFKLDPSPSESSQVVIVDYKPGLHKHLDDLTSSWLTGEINGQLEEEDETILQTPDEEHFSKGGFLFFAKLKDKIVGFVALKRMDDDTFEFTRLYVNPDYRNLKIDKKLIERCICRCKENEATELWHQTNLNHHLAHHIYYSLGFTDREAPSQMQVLDQTQKVMCLEL